MALDRLINMLPLFWDGLQTTLYLTIMGLFMGTVLGVIMGFIRAYKIFIFSYLVYGYEKLLRGIPLLVIFLSLWLVPRQFGLRIDAIYAAIFGLGLRSAAYQAQIIRGAINSVPEGQIEASKSIGMTRLQSIRHIVLPQVLRLSIPGWSNEFTIVLKDTSIAIAIGITELMRRAEQLSSIHFDITLEIFLLVALIYFIIVFSTNKTLALIEEKYRMAGFEVEVER
ncbi:MAG: amino acid ABC transporter permease [Candidatus Saliniplasma sp.]